MGHWQRHTLHEGRVREKKQGFPCRYEKHTTATIGDRSEESVLPVYKCKIKNLKGKILTFFTVALPQITGNITCPPAETQLQHLFPEVEGVESLRVQDPVDYLIGSEEIGSQPIRERKAKGGGELYIWKNSFGRCLGGRHELVANKGMARTLGATRMSKEELNGFTHFKGMVNYPPCPLTFNPESVAAPMHVAHDAIHQQTRTNLLLVKGADRY